MFLRFDKIITDDWFTFPKKPLKRPTVRDFPWRTCERERVAPGAFIRLISMDINKRGKHKIK
jgi:hypothetical protein